MLANSDLYSYYKPFKEHLALILTEALLKHLGMYSV